METVGDGVTGVKPGDRVMYAMVGSSYADYAIVRADRLLAVPDELDLVRVNGPNAASTASASANTRNVRCVPIRGIRSNAEANVPTSEPAVEIGNPWASRR